MKIRNFLLSLFLVTSTCCVTAQSEGGKTGALLWKISGKGLSKPSYLLGTMHFKAGDYLDSIPGARTALESSEQVVGEMALPDMDGLQVQMQQAMMMKSDTTYHMLYNDQEYQYVNEQLLSVIGVGLDQMGIIIPAGINLAFTQLIYLKYFPQFDPTKALDSYIQMEAISANKSVLGLETIENQIYVLLKSSSLKDQAEDLLCTLENQKYAEDQIKQMLADYDRKDLNALYQIMNDNTNPCPYSQSEMDLLLKDRNNAWLQILPGIIKDKSSFIAVGAGHLPGEEGLLNQLEKDGYKIEPIDFP